MKESEKHGGNREPKYYGKTFQNLFIASRTTYNNDPKIAIRDSKTVNTCSSLKTLSSHEPAYAPNPMISPI